MVNHMTTLGFRVHSPEDFENIAEYALSTGTRIKAKHGQYAFALAGEGIEIWLQIDKKNQVIGLNPHFSGSSRMNIGLTAELKPDENNKLDGSFHAWAEPDDSMESGSYPFVFDVPNRGVYGQILTPQSIHVQLSAFAHEVTIYKDEEEFNLSQDSELKFAVESFIPSGLFDSEGTPSATAIFTGRIVETAEIVNEQSKLRFTWALVRTLGGEIDVVIDQELVNKEMIVGGIISGSFWLSAKFQDEPVIKKKSNVIERIFRKNNEK
ncbi:hypothetical protein SAMN05720606_11137 [Paenibacillus polysaccharolyticus]|uniref:Uncharacterized protein n=1 Tax=Paenibacillus polysaccharolyticus TaxID=582692 RepID=A0A1G5JI91_9BACL|nr:hypothetical protein [Paenibacillus polysaccharolyticus]MDP9701559.1 hypothetical protein [Paenibacillus intestini]SCY87489.1 hypothetical protein SAMN05720606_11137 [Paenibacillus polysaccharolyticus]